MNSCARVLFSKKKKTDLNAHGHSDLLIIIRNFPTRTWDHSIAWPWPLYCKSSICMHIYMTVLRKALAQRGVARLHRPRSRHFSAGTRTYTSSTPPPASRRAIHGRLTPTARERRASRDAHAGIPLLLRQKNGSSITANNCTCLTRQWECRCSRFSKGIYRAVAGTELGIKFERDKINFRTLFFHWDGSNSIKQN
jgi:hypothetical protein